MRRSSAWVTTTVTQSYAKSFFWLKKAAEQGHAEAHLKISIYYFKGYGVEKDKVAHFMWGEKAAQGVVLSAEHNTGSAYETGDGVNQDYQKAFHGIRRRQIWGMLMHNTNWVACTQLVMALRKRHTFGGRRWQNKYSPRL
jgi:hypothetical protein